MVARGHSGWHAALCPGRVGSLSIPIMGFGPWDAVETASELSHLPQPPSPWVGIPTGFEWCWIMEGDGWLSTSLPKKIPYLLSKMLLFAGRASSPSSGWAENPTSTSAPERRKREV